MPTDSDRRVTSSALSSRSAARAESARRPRLGIPRGWLQGRLDAGVRDAFERLVAQLAEEADVVAADVDTMTLAWEHYTPIVRAEGAIQTLDDVRHAKYGEGVVIGLDRDIATVMFAGAGERSIMAEFLEKLR